MAETADGGPTRGRPDPLLLWSLGTFDVVGFVLVLVIAGHAVGALADVLGGLDTAIGLALFAYLWVLVVAGSYWTLARAPIETATTGRVLLHAFVAGALAGIGFVAGVIAGASIVFGADLAALAFFLVVGTGVAVVVGGIVGLVFGLVNLSCYRLGGRFVVRDAATPDRR